MYRHTQAGHLTIVILAGAGATVALLVATGHGALPTVWPVLAVLAATAFLFGSLTTEVDQRRFRFWFGPGVWRRSFELADIQACTAVTNPWWYGWGIHRTPDGWLYNVSGNRAIELTLRDGRRLRVGTDEPDQLCRVIRAAKGVA